MKIIHTSDWHLGQLFHGHDRSAEHQTFLDWLVALLDERQPDALLVAGDIFDHANPSGRSQKQFYRFLAETRQRCPKLDIVVIAGNHDSAGRLEAPESLLSAFGVNVVGQLQPDDEPERAVIPLHDAEGDVAAWCLGVPYLRPGDVPRQDGERPNYIEGIAASYRQHLDAALQRRQPTQAVIAMGHLHARGGRTSEDSERRLVIGGEEAVDSEIFDKQLAYVALGHLHLAQIVGGEERIRYCGSPLPLSFTEIDYPHQILEVHLEGPDMVGIDAIPVPRPRGMMRVPREPKPLTEALSELESLDLDDIEAGQEPWLEVRVLLEGPEPGLRQRIEEALVDKPVRLVKISPVRKHRNSAEENDQEEAKLALELEHPDAMFRRCYRDQWEVEPPKELQALFQELQDLAHHEDDT